jgi:putative MATE family efflux protein
MKEKVEIAAYRREKSEFVGEQYSSILSYFFPEFITNMLIYALPFWIDAAFIAALESTQAYATLGITNNFIHTLIKVAEAFSVGTVVLSGSYNGKAAFHEAGRALVDAFWITTAVGTVFSALLFWGAESIYQWYNVAPEISALGVPFLKVRAIGVFCMFMYFALVGFMRGIKNTKTPMWIFIFGSFVFVFFDYALIFGFYSIPALGLQGSAIATCVQYAVMLSVSLFYIIRHPEVRRYGINLLSPFKSFSNAFHLIRLTIPVLLDKVAMAFAYVWLGKMMASMGTLSIAAFCVVRDMERFAFIPAIAFAQVITFLVSNDVALTNFDAAKQNIRRIIILTSFMVASLLVFFSFYAATITKFFDKKGEISLLATQAFPLISLLVFFDLLQIILSGALRGSGNAYVVMIVRLVVFGLFFGPVSYFITSQIFENELAKFIALYGVFYLGNAVMTIIYMYWFSGEEWKKGR